MISVVPAHSKKLFTQFIEYPHRLYRGDPNYVPQLNAVQRQFLHPTKNPFFRSAEAQYFLALDGNENVVGRIAAIHNKAHTNLYGDHTGFFGCFDCVNDREVAGGLLTKAASFLKTRGLKHMIGPENLSTNDSVGVLSKGFNKPPVFLMPYNYPYYGDLLAQNNLQPVMTLYSYLLKTEGFPQHVFTRAQDLQGRLQERGITIRPINMNHYREEILRMQVVYNEANTGSWGFLPLDKEGFLHMANELKALLCADNVLLAEKGSELIGYAVTVPDYNQVFRRIPNGRLYPFGWYRLLTGRRKINAIRIMILGVLPSYRRLGVDWCLYARIAAGAPGARLAWGEACYVMQENVAMNQMLRKLEAEVIKEYQLYKGDI